MFSHCWSRESSSRTHRKQRLAGVVCKTPEMMPLSAWSGSLPPGSLHKKHEAALCICAASDTGFVVRFWECGGPGPPGNLNGYSQHQAAVYAALPCGLKKSTFQTKVTKPRRVTRQKCCRSYTPAWMSEGLGSQTHCW